MHHRKARLFRAAMMTEHQQVQYQLATARGRPRARVSYNSMVELLRVGEEIALISTDVFDTLLLRRFGSERSRIIEGERLFSDFLAKRGRKIDPDFLVEARLQSQRLAFRSLNLSGTAGEVSLLDIISRQLGVLGLPPSLVIERLRIEVQVEKRSLFANRELADVLRELRRAGSRIVALSDTTLPADAVHELIRHFHGPELVERVYSSADQNATKREGSLFLAVAERESVPLGKILHIGDDLLADVATPSNLGVVVRHVPRPSYGRYIRSANGALAELGQAPAPRRTIHEDDLLSRRRRFLWARCLRSNRDAVLFDDLALRRGGGEGGRSLFAILRQGRGRHSRSVRANAGQASTPTKNATRKYHDLASQSLRAPPYWQGAHQRSRN